MRIIISRIANRIKNRSHVHDQTMLTCGSSASSQSRKRLPVSMSRMHRYSTSRNATEKATLTIVLRTMPKRLPPWISPTMAAMARKAADALVIMTNRAAKNMTSLVLPDT